MAFTATVTYSNVFAAVGHNHQKEGSKMLETLEFM